MSSGTTAFSISPIATKAILPPSESTLKTSFICLLKIKPVTTRNHVVTLTVGIPQMSWLKSWFLHTQEVGKLRTQAHIYCVSGTIIVVWVNISSHLMNPLNRDTF